MRRRRGAWSRALGAAAGILAPCLGLPVPTLAQEVVLRGSADVAIDARLAGLLREAPLIVARDTAFEAGDTIRRSVLVVDATLVHEGVVEGDLVVVDAGAFIRPGAVVEGDLVNAGGGLYRSEIASVGGRIIDLPVAPYTVTREADRIVIRAGEPAPAVVLDGFMGLHPPTYDRVNGLTANWGATLRLPTAARIRPELHGQAGWHTQRGEPGYAATFSMTRSAFRLAAGYSRGWGTNERWIRDDVSNSLIYLLAGQDVRDYHEVERRWAELARDFAPAGGRVRARAALRFQIEDGTSIPAGSPWFAFGSSDPRPNPDIDDGRITSLGGALHVAWDGEYNRLVADVDLEVARPWADAPGRFEVLRARWVWATAAFADHTLAFDGFGQAVLGGGTLPRQRWSFVGGAGTLPTLATAGQVGDRIAFLETQYIIPLPERLGLPVLGAPRLHLVHAAGRAWTEGQDGRLHQEAGLRLDFPGVYFRYTVVPDDPGRDAFSVGVTRVFGRDYPWER